MKGVISMDLFKKITQLKNLTPNEQVLIRFIQEKPQEFVQLKPKEIAAQTYVSIPTLYRLVTKLQCAGIHELKVEISASLAKTNKQIDDIDYPILPSDSHYEVMQRLKQVYENTLQDTLDLCDPQELVAISKQMEQAASIDVYASSANVYFAKNFQFQMQEINVITQVPEVDYMQSLCASNSDQTHLAILISFGGRGPSFQNICHILKENHTPILLITSSENPLIAYADFVIYMSGYENHYHKMSSFSTRMTLLYILDTLYAIYFKRNYEANRKHKITAYERMSRNIHKSM